MSSNFDLGKLGGLGGGGGDPRRSMAIKFAPLLLAAVAIGGMLIKGCQEGPFGRKQVVAINPQQEAQLGLQAYKEALGGAHVIDRGPIVDAVKQIAERLIKAAQRPEFLSATRMKAQEFKWEVSVVQSPEVNAFCLPGGKIVVFTGILPVAQTDAGLATVMGHEISHALAHHGAERMAQTQIAQIGLSAASGSMGDMDPGQKQQLLQLLNAGAKYGILGYSRSHESEADHMGLLLMALAGYDPEESSSFWERMKAKSGGKQPPEFASTHPSHDTRIRDLHGWLPEVAPLYAAAERKTKTQPLPLGGGVTIERDSLRDPRTGRPLRAAIDDDSDDGPTLAPPKNQLPDR